MNKLLTGLVICGLALVVGCQNSSTSSTTKSTKTTPTGATVSTETKPKDDMKKDGDKTEIKKEETKTPPQ